VLTATADSYLLHEHLEDVNEPLYFHQFMDRAGVHGLQYLGEAQLSAMVAATFGAEAEQTLRKISPDLLHMEQYMDFLRNRMFRQTLLCQAAVQLDRALRPQAVRDFYISSCAKPACERSDAHSAEGEQFAVPGGPTLTTRDPLMKAAMLHLSQSWPLPVRFDDLLAAARARLAGENGHPDVASTAFSSDAAEQLAARLLNCYASTLVEFSLCRAQFVAHVSPRPVASSYARLRAGEDSKVINQRMEPILLSEPARLVLCNLDGRHDRASLIELVTAWVQKMSAGGGETPAASGPQDALVEIPPAERAAQYVDELLIAFARGALLTA
jgi:methyltransferase-like protein